MVDDLLGPHTGCGRGQGDRIAARLQQQRGRVGGVQVVVQPTPDRGPSGAGRLEPFGLLDGVRPEQVVRAEPPGACSVTRCAWASSASSRGACSRGTPARLAAAATPMSGPGWQPNSRNSRAAGGVRLR
ncbi:hypothetical protein [Micromonospora sp. CA-246542]|uniref:hypothetical protein n=1 Tax=Micromonospora sp. CA-246542 TaxID=3239959 RepID=UPI003D8DDDF1